MVIATLTPAADRPYVDGSTNNSAVAMVFGYNGLARFGSVGVSAAGTGSVSATQGAHFGGDNSTGWLKLFEHNLASQVGWLYPVAAAGILLGLWRRGRGRTDRVRAGTAMWTGWLLMTGLALSAGSVPHSTYVVALAPALAALSAYALTRTVAMYREPRSTAEQLALPALTAVTLAWAVHLSADFPDLRARYRVAAGRSGGHHRRGQHRRKDCPGGPHDPRQRRRRWNASTRAVDVAIRHRLTAVRRAAEGRCTADGEILVCGIGQEIRDGVDGDRRSRTVFHRESALHGNRPRNGVCRRAQVQHDGQGFGRS